MTPPEDPWPSVTYRVGSLVSDEPLHVTPAELVAQCMEIAEELRVTR